MKRVWIVIYTLYGILQEPEIFYSISSARNRFYSLRESNRLKDYDELDFFEKRIRVNTKI